MEVQVIYQSRKGNTQRLAQAIAHGAGVPAQRYDEAKLEAKLDILFLGGSIYAGGLDKGFAEFLRRLPRGQAALVVPFGTSLGGLALRDLLLKAMPGYADVLSEQGFYCKGSFLLANRGKPDAADLQRARAFAGEVLAAGQKD